MSHVAFMTHKPLLTVVASKGEVAGMSALMSNKLISVSELFLAVLTGIPRQIQAQF